MDVSAGQRLAEAGSLGIATCNLSRLSHDCNCAIMDSYRKSTVVEAGVMLVLSFQSK